MRRVAWALVLSLAGVGVAAGQEDLGPEAEDVAPAGEEEAWDAPSEPETLEPIDEPPQASNDHDWMWPERGEIQLRFVYEDLRLDLDVDHVKGGGAPVGTRQARRRIDYENRHTSARIEAAYGVSLEKDLSLGLRGGLGWGTSTITVESKRGSDLSGGGPAFDTNLESDVDFNVSFALDLRWRLDNALFVGFTYQLLYGFGSFDDQVMYSVVEGRIDYLTQDFTAIFGVTLGELVSVWGGAGFVLYWNDIDLDEKGGPDRWDVNLTQDGLLKGVLGGAIHHGPLAAWVQFQFVPKPSVGVGIGYTF